MKKESLWRKVSGISLSMVSLIRLISGVLASMNCHAVSAKKIIRFACPCFFVPCFFKLDLKLFVWKDADKGWRVGNCTEFCIFEFIL